MEIEAIKKKMKILRISIEKDSLFANAFAKEYAKERKIKNAQYENELLFLNNRINIAFSISYKFLLH